MNKLEATGQKWFWLILIWISCPSIWEVSRFIYRLFASGIIFTDVSINYFGMLIDRIFIMLFIALCFFLLYRGFVWIKWLFAGVSLVVSNTFVFLVWSNFAGSSTTGNAQSFLYRDLASIFFFFLIPCVLLLFLPASKAFLRYRQKLRKGELDPIAHKLDQIGKDE